MHIGRFAACQQGWTRIEQNTNGQLFPVEFRPVEKTLMPAVFETAFFKAG
jgi:hypothetical protein